MSHIPPQITTSPGIPPILHNCCEMPVDNPGEIDFGTGIMVGLAECSVLGHGWEGGG